MPRWQCIAELTLKPCLISSASPSPQHSHSQPSTHKHKHHNTQHNTQHTTPSLRLAVDRPTEGWQFSSGFIDEAMVREQLFPAGDDTVCFLCGPPPMVSHLLVSWLIHWLIRLSSAVHDPRAEHAEWLR